MRCSRYEERHLEGLIARLGLHIEEVLAPFAEAAERLTRQLVQRLEKLGHKVTLEPKEDAA
jgi:hypothetical protein